MINRRVTYSSQWGGDGKMHRVPVHWDEYVPVVGTGYIQMEEDNEINNDSITHRQRLAHIHSLLNEMNLDVYRRRIASKIQSY